MDCIAELPVLNAKPIADVFRRIPRLIPDDTSHAWAYSPRVDQPLGLGVPTTDQMYFKSRQFHALARMERLDCYNSSSALPGLRVVHCCGNRIRVATAAYRLGIS